MQENKPETQETPKGATIPVPTRGEFFRDLAKVAKPRKSSDDGGSGSPDE